MLSKIFGSKDIAESKSMFEKVYQENKCEIDVIIVIDSTGKGVYSYVPNNSKAKVDESLISMFISAINNFSQEIFDKNSNPSINVMHGELGIQVESKENYCIAIIGRNPNEELRKTILEALDYVNTFFGDFDASYENEAFDKNLHLFMKQKFSKFIGS